MLNDILAHKREELKAAKSRLPLEMLKDRVRQYKAQHSLGEALKDPKRLTLIAELKRKSPSRGLLRERFDPVSLAQALEKAGASALSVLTDEFYFGGSLNFLRDARQFTEVPVLRKDFIVDPYQVYEAAFYQADAVLLIVRALTEKLLSECLSVSGQLGMDALVEVHSADELHTALKAGSQIIGINHRDLETFTMDLNLSEQLVPEIPKSKVIVAESGILQPSDLRRVRELGVDAVLIGEALMVAPDPARKIQELFAGVW